jgi:hypothetical protein
VLAAAVEARDRKCGRQRAQAKRYRAWVGGPVEAIVNGREIHVSEPRATIQPIYADRASGQKFADARAMVNMYLQRFGERAGAALDSLDSTGYTLVRKGSATIGINVLDDHGVLLFVAPVMPVPRAATDVLYRRLLELSFLTTSDAAFAIDTERQEIVVRALRRLSGLDYEEFEDLLETVGKVADQWDNVLQAEFGERLRHEVT